MAPSIFALFMLFAWIPIVLGFFMAMPARRAVCWAVVGGWLFLPPIGIRISGFPDYTKTTAVTFAILIGTALFDPGRLLKLRPQWYDLPIVLFSLAPMASALSNGLGVYDGISSIMTHIFLWLLPYLVGRLYFGNLDGLGALCKAIVMGGLLYVPLCLVEIRLSPIWMRTIYNLGGFQGTRFGGFRPNVFFAFGLELGMWMTAASLTAWWMWRSGAIPKKWNLPVFGKVPYGMFLLPALLVTTVLCRSAGALALLMMGMGILWISAIFQTRMVLLAVVLFVPIYIYARASNIFTGESAVSVASSTVGPERAQSLEYRFQCEALLLEHALKQPYTGWGGWGRNMVFFDKERTKAVATDSYWILLLGIHGFLAVSFWYAMFALPVLLFISRFPASTWSTPTVGPAAVCGTLSAMFMIDCLLNAFPNLIYCVAIGGLSAALPTTVVRQTREERRGDARKAEDSNAMLAIVARDPSAVSKVARGEKYMGMARLLEREGRDESAILAMRHALDLIGESWTLCPDDMIIRKKWCDCSNDLAWCLANHADTALRNPGEAVELARRASLAMPEEDTYWNTLGSAQYRMGDFRESIISLERSIELGGGTAFDYGFLAMAHSRLGDLEQGEYWLSQAIQWVNRERPGHLVMKRLCEEARTTINLGPSRAVTKA